jgi:predicted RNase H-like HicB family nuclease
MRDLQLMQPVKIVIERHPNGHVAYPVGIQGAVVGEGEIYEDALADVKSAIHFHVETFGRDVLKVDSTAASSHDDCS